MVRKELNAISTYADEEQLQVLKEAATRENRSLSNYMLTAGLARARDEHGLNPAPKGDK